MPNLELTMPDGRHITGYADDEGDTALVFHNGTPGGAVPLSSMIDAARAAGLRVVSANRPGYGESHRLPGRRVVDVVADTHAVLDHLGLGDYLTLGWSGGGPHALACAAAGVPRCRGAATIASVGPYAVDDLDFLAGMGQDNITEFGLAAEGEEALRPFLTEQAAGMREITAADVAGSLETLVDDVDRSFIGEHLADWLASSFRHAVEGSPDGWLDDDLAFAKPWGFELRDIGVPVAIWQGHHDLMVPPAHGEWLAARVPGARAHVHPEHGHLSLVASLPEILADLAAHTG